MDLKEQIIGMLFSFLYGLFLGGLYNFNYNLLFKLPKLKKVLFNFLFVFDLVLLYFIIIKKINGGIIHPYFYLLIVLGFLVTFKYSKKVRTFIKVPVLKKEKKKKEMPKSVKK